MQEACPFIRISTFRTNEMKSIIQRTSLNGLFPYNKVRTFPTHQFTPSTNLDNYSRQPNKRSFTQSISRHISYTSAASNVRECKRTPLEKAR